MSDKIDPIHFSALKNALDEANAAGSLSIDRWNKTIGSLLPRSTLDWNTSGDKYLQIASGLLTDTASPLLVGSADVLDTRITKIESMMAGISASLATQRKPENLPFVTEMNGKLDGLSKEIAQIRASEVPAIKQVNDIILNVGPFLANAVAVQGLLAGQDSKIDALTNRVSTIEQNREKAWARTQWLITTFIGIGTAVIGWVVGYYMRTP